MLHLHDWFKENERPFPWREERSPYKVWISEVMLQQTRASVVVSYFLKWMELFPDVNALAEASLDAVIKAWEGLGYYSRARNLHRGAQQIVKEFGGKIPEKKEELARISGLGPYTIGAILNFGFQKKAAAVDANVLRVISRLTATAENICSQKVRKKIEERTLDLLDEKEPWVTSEALIELGATICLPKKPLCLECPLQKNCLGEKKGIAESLPIKNEKRQVTLLHRVVTVVISQGQILVRKGEIGRVMEGLYEFPYFEGMDLDFEKRLGFKVEYVKALKEVSHTFTRYKARLFPYLLKTKTPVGGIGTWVLKEKLQELPFSSGHKKIMMQL